MSITRRGPGLIAGQHARDQAHGIAACRRHLRAMEEIKATRPLVAAAIVAVPELASAPGQDRRVAPR
jgi:hypothetical protein